MSNYYNILMDVVGTILVCSILFAGKRQKQRQGELNIILLNNLMICCILVFLFDIPSLILDGSTFSGARTILWILDSAYWIFQIIYCWLWIVFADYWTFDSRGRLKRYSVIYAIPMIIEIALIVTNIFTGWIFTLDEFNVYTRGAYYLPNMTPYCIYITVALLITFWGHRQNAVTEKNRNSLSLMIYMFLPICGVIFDAFVYGISWVWPMVALSLLLVYLNVQQQIISEEQLAMARVETVLAESRMTVMLSQIQPHFLYNALGAIRELCRKDPSLAEQATIQFSEFLRGNLDSLTAEKPISFERELAHTKNYLFIEKMRFGDYLNIEYDIQATMFRLPTLTLQPIVENAVRYGVTKREEGGTVTIETKETEAAFVITVRDDGVGFDVEALYDDGRTHVGIQNVRERLTMMSKGTLNIQSTPGEGTVAVITLPKGEMTV